MVAKKRQEFLIHCVQALLYRQHSLSWPLLLYQETRWGHEIQWWRSNPLGKHFHWYLWLSQWDSHPSCQVIHAHFSLTHAIVVQTAAQVWLKFVANFWKPTHANSNVLATVFLDADALCWTFSSKQQASCWICCNFTPNSKKPFCVHSLRSELDIEAALALTPQLLWRRIENNNNVKAGFCFVSSSHINYYELLHSLAQRDRTKSAV